MAVKRGAGFTLLELLVVIAIIIVMAGLLAPAVVSLSSSNNLSSAGRVVSNMLTVARSEAINRRRLVQFRVVTKWVDANGTEDTTASYRKFSVWVRPQPGDSQQSNTANDPYIQVSKWETLPTGVTFETKTDNYTLPPASDPRYPGVYFLDRTLTSTNSKTGIRLQNATLDVAWIEFSPTGAANYTGTIPARVYLLIAPAIWNGTDMASTQHNYANWLATSVDTLVGRINILRP